MHSSYGVRTSLPIPGLGQAWFLASVAGGWTEQGFVSGLQTAKPMRSFRFPFIILFREIALSSINSWGFEASIFGPNCRGSKVLGVLFWKRE